MIICRRCNSENPASFRFCGTCGEPLGAAEPEAEAARKIVTALFCDVVGSTALGEELDPEALRNVLGRYFGDVSATIARHGGTVRNYAGDSVMAVFGIPQVREDDALRAVRAAAEINGRLPIIAAEVGLELRLRIGVNTGVVITDQERNLALGDAINVAARLEQSAAPGEIVLGEATFQLVRGAVEVDRLDPLELKGKSEPVAAYRLLKVDQLATGIPRRLDLRLVNRLRELSEMRAIWSRTVEESSCHLLTLLGSAGVGKSRLAKEFFASVGDSALVLRGRCLHYGEGITFWPIIEALADGGQAAEAALRDLTEGRAGMAEELFLKVRRALEALAIERPVILYIDDLQWAEPMLVDLLRSIAELASDAPIQIVCTARTELLEHQPQWIAERANATVVKLDSLVPDDCAHLVDQLRPDLDADARAYAIRTSEGNPLFLEELVLGAGDQASSQLPPTIHALLAARIERLSGGERELLAAGAVEGQVFHRSGLRAVCDPAAVPDVDRVLRDLSRKDLIRPHLADLPGDEAFRFRHLLIRDVAYELLARSRRADLHELYASWVEQNSAKLAEHEELSGWHLERAVLDRRAAHESPDQSTARRAAGHLSAAAHRAADRGDLSASQKLLERALAMAPTGDPLRAELTVSLAERVVEAGNLDRADELLAAAEREHPDDPSVALGRLLWMVGASPEESRTIYEQKAPAIGEELSRTGNERGLASLHMLGFWMDWLSSRATPAAVHVRSAAEHAMAAGDSALRSRALGWYVATLIFGSADAGTIESELSVIESTEPGPYLQAFLDLGHGEVRRLRGRFEEAIAMTLRAREGFRALGLSTMTATCEQTLGWIELSAGNPDAAREALLRSDAILGELGERAVRSTTHALLARALVRLDRPDEAAAAVERAESLSSPSDRINFAITNEVRARLAISTDDVERAEQLARDALGHALATDFVTYQAQIRLALGEILFACHKSSEAAAEARAAAELFRAKGDRPGLESVDRFLGAVA